MLIPLPNDAARLDILKIHSTPVAKRGDIDYESVVKLTGTNSHTHTRARARAHARSSSLQALGACKVPTNTTLGTALHGYTHTSPLSPWYDVVWLRTDGFNGADLRNVVTEGGIFAIREE